MLSISQSPLEGHWVVVLCGGRGSRLGSVTESIPKSLALIHDKPIIWYTFLSLFKDGFRKFIFPLGYRGSMIEEFITKEFDELDCEIRFMNTGEDTPVAERLHIVSSQIAEKDDFFLVNGDTFFDFDILGMYHFHRRKNALATLSSVKIVSDYGILIEEGGELKDFSRDEKVSYFTLNRKKNARGHVNSGFVWLLILVPLSFIIWFGMNNITEAHVSPKIGSTLGAFVKILSMLAIGLITVTAGLWLMLPASIGGSGFDVDKLIVLPIIVMATVFLLKHMPAGLDFKKNIRRQYLIFGNKHTWAMTVIYTMTFGSFIGYATCFALAIKVIFGY